MRLYENTFAKVAKTAELAKKSQALTEDEVDEQMKHACNMLNVKQVSSKDKKGVESLGLRGRKKKDMDDMDDLWGEAFADTGVDEEDAEQKKNKKDKGCSDCPPRPVQYPAPVISLVPKMAASSSTPQASPKMAASSSTAANNDKWLNRRARPWPGRLRLQCPRMFLGSLG